MTKRSKVQDVNKSWLGLTKYRIPLSWILSTHMLASIVILFFLFFCEVTKIFAFWAPLRDVEAWVEILGEEYKVHYKVYDPKSGSWQEESWGWFSMGSERTVHNLTVQDGVVTWTAAYRYSIHEDWTQNVLYAVYDPGSGSWQEGSWGWFSMGSERTVHNLTVQDGVVAWTAAYRYSIHEDWTQNVLYAVYEPGSGSWPEGS